MRCSGVISAPIAPVEKIETPLQHVTLALQVCELHGIRLAAQVCDACLLLLQHLKKHGVRGLWYVKISDGGAIPPAPSPLAQLLLKIAEGTAIAAIGRIAWTNGEDV
jgi:hypothetical protein